MWRFVLVFLLFPTMALAQDTLEAADDAYDTLPDSSITVTGPGLLANDALVEGDSLVAVLLTEPANGELRFDGAGGFSYRPAMGFAGIDSFSYDIRTIPFQQISLDTTRSNLIFDAEVDIGLATRGDVDSTAMKGTLGFYLEPASAPFESVHLKLMDVTIDESIDLEINYSILGRLRIKADKDSLSLFIKSPGAPTSLTNGSFLQTGNKTGVAGILNLSGTGFIGDSVPDDPQVFDTETDLDLSGSVLLDGTTIEMTVPVAYVDTVALSDDATAFLNLGGSLLGNGPYKEGLASNIATVYITVEPFSNTASEDFDTLPTLLEQSFPNPATTRTRIGYQLGSASYASLRVYDTLGREVATLVDGFTPSGRHEVLLDTSEWPSGMYLYQLKSGPYQASNTLVVMR